MNCGIGCRLGLDPALLWLWLAAAAPVWPLAWELPCAVGVALKKKKRERDRERKKNKQKNKTSPQYTGKGLLQFCRWASCPIYEASQTAQISYKLEFNVSLSIQHAFYSRRSKVSESSTGISATYTKLSQTCRNLHFIIEYILKSQQLKGRCLQQRESHLP